MDKSVRFVRCLQISVFRNQPPIGFLNNSKPTNSGVGLSVRLFGFNRTSRSYRKQGKIESRRTNCAKSKNEIALLQRGWRLAGAPCSPPPRPPSALEVGTRTAAAHRRRSARSLLAARVGGGAHGATAARGSPALPARRSSSSLCLAALLLVLGLDEEIVTHGHGRARMCSMQERNGRCVHELRPCGPAT